MARQDMIITLSLCEVNQQQQQRKNDPIQTNEICKCDKWVTFLKAWFHIRLIFIWNEVVALNNNTIKITMKQWTWWQPNAVYDKANWCIQTKSLLK